jgi:hypothetical protein
MSCEIGSSACLHLVPTMITTLVPREIHDSFSPIISVLDITAIPEVIRFQITWTWFDKPPVRAKALKGKRKPNQNIFFKDSDLEGSTVRDRAILPDLEATKFGLVLINSCDIATRREEG